MADEQRFRITFAKEGTFKYTSHLDLMRAWERSLRRAGVPLAYSQGFNPRPKQQLAAALPLGHAGEQEIIDVWMERPISVEDLTRALVPVLPDGLRVKQVRQVSLEEPALQTQVVSAEYQVTVEFPAEGDEAPPTPEEMRHRVEQLLAAKELPAQRRGREYDLRPLIEKLWLESVYRNAVTLGMQLAAREGATGRAEAVVEALGLDGYAPCYRRQRLIMED
ncbi:MAG TPA: DUF2344 domain-containing protein [Chloroflexi bacterium]|nr:DUF2344 domain-containing protein [Chloroflexota bacterium]